MTTAALAHQPKQEQTDGVLKYEPAGAVVSAFHRSNAFVRGLRGPVGSSKTSACVMEAFTRSCEQVPSGGVRRVRGAILRNVYGELKSTTIKTFSEWLPFMTMRWDTPISARGMLPLGDGTTLDLEVMFIAIDRPEETGKLRSLELTWAWMNEASEMAREVFDMVTQRVGRYPPMKYGGPTWTGVMMDTNAPDTDHWYYKFAEVDRPEGFEFFDQPPGVLPDGDGWKVNPEAENLANLPAEYYTRMLAGKRREWIKVFLANEYGTFVDGRPVYPEYADDVHTSKKPLGVLLGLPIIVGLDYGREPAAVFIQITPRGQLRVIDELYGWDIGVGAFAEDILKPHIALHYRGKEILFVGDPAGMAKESDERSAFDVLASHEIVAVPAHTNRLMGRLEAVRHYLGRMVDGQPALLVDPKCERVRKGFLGKYHYKRVQVGFERYKDTPEKDEYSHPADALQYAALYARMEDMGGGRFKEKLNYPRIGLR
jgi:hypothetical protein